MSDVTSSKPHALAIWWAPSSHLLTPRRTPWNRMSFFFFSFIKPTFSIKRFFSWMTSVNPRFYKNFMEGVREFQWIQKSLLSGILQSFFVAILFFSKDSQIQNHKTLLSEASTEVGLCQIGETTSDSKIECCKFYNQQKRKYFNHTLISKVENSLVSLTWVRLVLVGTLRKNLKQFSLFLFKLIYELCFFEYKSN